MKRIMCPRDDCEKIQKTCLTQYLEHIITQSVNVFSLSKFSLISLGIVEKSIKKSENLNPSLDLLL